MNADRYLGKRFTWTNGAAPDITIAGFDPDKGVRFHCLDGGRQWITPGRFIAAINCGILIESTEAPFVWRRDGSPS